MSSKIDPQTVPTWMKLFPFDFLRWLSDNFTAAQSESNRVLSGTGSPLGVVVAPVGTLYLRTDGGAGTTLYVKESGTGTAGWVAK